MKFDRRLFLRGLGGASLAVPFLGSVQERMAKAQGVPAAGIQPRFIVMFTHYGCLTDLWFPSKSDGELTAADYEATNLAALAPHASKLLMPRGIRAMNEWTFQNGSAATARGQGNDPHTQVTGTFFSCEPVTPNNSSPVAFNTAKTDAKPIGPTLDHVMAQQLNTSGTPLFMRVGGRNDNEMSAISYSAAETQFPGIGNPSQAYDNITGLFMSGGSGGEGSPDTYAVVGGKNVLDIVADDLATLKRFDMSASDKRKLEAWEQLLTETTKPLVSAQCDAEMAMTLNLTDANIAAASGGGGLGGGGDTVAKKVTDTLDAADIYSNIAVLAALCNANNVIFLKYPGNYVFSELGINAENHGLSHRIGNANQGGDCVPGVNDDLETIDRYHIAKFAHLVATLDSVEEGDGTVLDNCAAVYFQELSDGQAHNLNNMPIIQAGSCGGYFKTGVAVNVDDVDPTIGNSSGVCGPNGDGNIGQAEIRDATSTPTNLAKAPINKYYCNLMNAMGVKADESGFPTVGGTQEVTHFGRFDETEKFYFGGGDGQPINPPEPDLTWPGEFEDLKA